MSNYNVPSRGVQCNIWKSYNSCKHATDKHFVDRFARELPQTPPFICPLCGHKAPDQMSIIRHWGITHKMAIKVFNEQVGRPNCFDNSILKNFEIRGVRDHWDLQPDSKDLRNIPTESNLPKQHPRVEPPHHTLAWKHLQISFPKCKFPTNTKFNTSKSPSCGRSQPPLPLLQVGTLPLLLLLPRASQVDDFSHLRCLCYRSGPSISICYFFFTSFPSSPL